MASHTETFNTKCSGLLDDEWFRVMYINISQKLYCKSIVTSLIPRPSLFLPSFAFTIMYESGSQSSDSVLYCELKRKIKRGRPNEAI